MKAITQSALIGLLNGIKGATFATLNTRTDAKLKKTGNPFAMPVTKESRVNVTLGFQYEAAVNRQRTREGTEADFEARPRQWGERVPGTFLVTHKGRTYLETKVERSVETPVYRDANGVELDPEAVKPFLPSRGGNRQGVEREIVVRDFALDSILAIRMKKEDYIILQPATVPAATATATTKV
jgi:hypothetical protein